MSKLVMNNKNALKLILLSIILCCSAIIYSEDKKNTKSPNTYKSIAAGYSHSLAIKSDGTLWTWGGNEFGQLGDGSKEDKDKPTQIGLETKWSKVYAGSQFSLALKSDGTLWSWGDNKYGSLGNGSTENQDQPAQVTTDTNWADIATSGATVLALKNDRTLWAWGYNEYGALGDGTNEHGNTPIQIGKDKDWVRISSAIASFAIKSNGTLWGWGKNSDSQLGDGTQDNKNTPIQIGKDKDWAEVAAGASAGFAIKKDGTLWAWGRSDAGLLGNEIERPVSYKKNPVKIGKVNTWSKVWTDGMHTFATRTDKTLWAWGAQMFSNLSAGDGTGKLPIYSTFPAKIGNDNNWLAVAPGSDHTLVLKADGALWVWGSNKHGQLGDGTKINKNTLIQIK